ncbi:RHS repeat-associated core domain-containing protein [Akkermansia sp.]|uniref:RHS repeat domain-containing protein n=1 Tax=Akkermansia sp. TaxID=1872421 RepID=UPI0025C27875|nr:RHS repeat-associated core domain-containing protein [Akkermansia sp.]MCC8148056.1 sugar-binding protein [Akkermansia sp.]
MSTSDQSFNGKYSSIPSYHKWYFGSTAKPAPQGMRSAPEPDPLPFEEIHEHDEITVGPPSTSADGHSAYGSFTIPEGEEGKKLYGTCSLFLGVDDWGSLEVKDSGGNVVAQVDLKENSQEAGDQGGHKYHSSTGGAQLPSGTYSWEVNQTNIDYDPEDDNVSICNYSIDVVPTEPGGKEKPDPCPCEGDTYDGSGGTPPSPSLARSGSAVRSGALGNYSSAGCSVAAESTATLMYWACNFGAFRGLGGLPAGRVELRAEEHVSGLENPSSLAYNHPLNSHLEVPEGGLAAGVRFDLVQGDRVIAMRCASNGVDVRPVGVDTSGGGRAALVTVEGQSCLQWKVMDGSEYLFSSETGQLLSYTTADKQVISNASAYLDVKHAQDGSLRQIWNLWDGLLQVESVTSTGYTIALYTPGQITGTDEQGFYTVTGTPFKTFSLFLSTEGQFTITEQTPGRQAYAVTWWKNGLAWNMRRGTGEDAVTTMRTRTELEPEDSVWQLVTEISKGGVTALRSCGIYQTTDVGDLLLTQVDGYGSPEAQTTQYIYDQCGRLKTETAPGGSQTHYTYDLYGRLLSRDEPWAESGRRITRYTYAHSGETNFNDEPATETVDLLPLEGHIKTLTSTAYNYTTANHVKRTEKRVTGLGVTGTRLTATEQWLASAPDVYARGRMRMTREIDGVQTWHDYAATTEHGALYTETVETRINGETVPGQSTRIITWITAEGQRVREENYLLLTSGEWALTESAAYEFDTQNRWVKKTSGNGRITQRELMCDGRLLWEINENGVRMDYAYDTARQLVEATRSAVMDGETVVTPETITSYTRDAAGRALATTIYAGAMQTVQTSSYDLLGRIVSATDVLDRVTAYAYSENGLTATQNIPSGATFITRSAPDGTVMEESGTGQRHLVYSIDLVNDGVRTFMKAVSGETETELQRSIVNGVGETLRTGRPNTTGGVIYTRRTYNAKGQMTKEQTDAGNAATTMAPTLWEYDAFGNRMKETWKLADPATVSNSRITTWSYGAEQAEDGVYRIVTTTKNNGQGTTYSETQKTLVSSLSSTLENKVVSIDPRGNISTQWSEYGAGALRTQKSSIPTSNITTTTTVIDSFITTQTDYAGLTSTQTRAYAATGITYAGTDGRGNTTTTKTDLVGRTVSVSDAAGNTTTTAYDPFFDRPSVVTNALGKTTCYSYDIRGRKTAEYGTATQPLLFGYDEADRMVSLTTFREDAGDITTDPTGRTDGDVTTWSYDEATGLLARKTYADGTHEDTAYNALNLKSTLTDARGIVTTWGYNLKKGVNNSVSYSDSTPGIQYAYNYLNQLTLVTDASGSRTIAYTPYNEPDTDTITIGGNSYQLQENYDIYGRSSGYTLKQGTNVLQEVSQGYEDNGRLASAGIMHEGTEQSFAYGYLAGSSLPASLAMPNGIIRELAYEEHRNLVTGIVCRQGETVLASRTQSYDTLGRPTTRTRQRGTEPARNDSFTYNCRSELTGAILGSDAYDYSYDNIGNRKTAQELAEELDYTANQLNQYTRIEESGETPFVPQYDANGNQTLIKTATGVWAVTYNAANRSVSFTSQDGNTVVECGYDYQGRRYMKKVTVNGTVTSHERYLYRSYLQIAALDMLNNRNVLRTLLWDPLEPVATRPLALVQNVALYCYGTDFNKNVTEVFDGQGAIAAAYDYSPYGTVAKTGNLDQPVQWSGEMNDEELALVYYNYRCYNPVDGRWINRDPIAEQGGWNLYEMLENNTITFYDEKGLAAPVVVCGGVAVGASTYTAANMMGLSVCACLATPACRELIVKLTKETLRRACIEGCHLAYDIQAVSCGLLLSARSHALCYERAAEDCASCIQECNRATR